ncbi:MAG: cupredoxin domain-containing protein [Anaerolineales bacterium]
MIRQHSLQFASMVLLLAILAACSSSPPPLQVTLVAEDIMWATETINAKVGQSIEITLRNDGALDHNFVIADLGIDTLLSPGDVEVVPAFSLDQPGTIQYICSIPGHEEAGMVGEIVVTE